ncbi:ParB/RepB/Spo0J family partition protein [Labrenzia sp. ac12]
MSAYQSIKVSLIDIPEGRLREVDQDWAECLTAMFADMGQKTPIDVVTSGKRFTLVAGAHRLTAAKIARWKDIDARILEPEDGQSADSLRLHEVVENLARKEFNALERCEALTELKRIYEALHPETRKGGKFGNQHTGGQRRLSDIVSFSQHAADSTGLSSRSIERAIAIFTGLSPEIRERLKGTAYAQKQSDLKTLAGLDADTQAQVLELILGDRPAVSSIADAVLKISGQEPESDTLKRQKTVSQYLPRLDRHFRANLFRGFKDEIVELVKKEGWLDG